MTITDEINPIRTKKDVMRRCMSNSMNFWWAKWANERIDISNWLENYNEKKNISRIGSWRKIMKKQKKNEKNPLLFIWIDWCRKINQIVNSWETEFNR